MGIVLLVVGLVTTAAGLVTIGFGIPINAFSLGNTLIIAGTVAVSAGLVLIGLAAVVGQLRRISSALQPQALARPAQHAETIESLVPPVARMTPMVTPHEAPARAPAPPRPASWPETPREVSVPDFGRAEFHSFETQGPEPLHPATGGREARGPLDWLRAKPRSASPSPNSSEPVVEVPDEAPLSPRASPRPPSPLADTAQRHEPPARFPPVPRDKHGFEIVWPNQATPPHKPESQPREFSPETPPASFAPRLPESKVPERHGDPSPAKATSEHGPAILKSGVIDGMPYTLYADGSIEAQMPDGTVKFASVDALRAHLERHD